MLYDNWITTYLIFLFTFSVSSVCCFYLDCLSPIKMIDTKVTKSTRYEMLQQYKFILPRVSLNVFLLTPIFFYYSDHIIDYNPEFIFMDFFKQIVMAGLLIDVFFYVTHKAMHHKYVYKWSHKIHHRFKKPVGMEAIYHHWFDLYFSNLLPIFLALWVLPSKNIYTWYTWVFIATSTTVLHSHSGWSKTGHDNHHKYSTVHFGVGIFMDKIFDTD
jgi:sterol desaturase/sphingolipid hydroxylase (fatty acid hydroxylase superfamily)